MPSVEQLREMAENIDNYKIGLDDTFLFKCLGCGKCCKNREDIILTARDLFNIAKRLNMSTEKAIEKYCNKYIGPQSRIPLIRLQPRGVNHVCPLLQDKKCIVHAVKPAVCALFPLGRYIECSKTGIDPKTVTAETLKTEYIIQPIECGRSRGHNTVRSWLEKFNMPIEDEFFTEWHALVMFAGDFCRDYEEKVSEDTMSMIWSGVAIALYLRYDTSKDFMPQFLENAKSLRRVIAEMRELEEKNEAV